MSLLSVILPSYNEELMIRKAAQTVSKILSDACVTFELIFVDDDSKDKTWKMIQEVSGEDKRVKGVHFSRNFGKESAIIAGAC